MSSVENSGDIVVVGAVVVDVDTLAVAANLARLSLVSLGQFCSHL